MDERHDVFMRRVAAWLAADLDAYMDCWHDDMVIELPSGRIEGKERYARLVRAGFDWAEPVAFDVHHLAFEDGRDIAEDGRDIALADWTIRARRRDDGVEVSWQGLSVCELGAGRIVWWREHHLAPPGPA
jgi:ketosteroid isomerase-like protein